MSLRITKELHNVIPEKTVVKKTLADIVNTITYELEDTQQAFKEKASRALAAVSLIDQFDIGKIEAPTIKKLQDFAKQELEERAKLTVGRKPIANKQFFIEVNPGLKFLVPPYDLEWTELGKADKHHGTFTAAMIGGTVYSGAGLGVFLSSPEKVLVRFSAMMDITYAWGDVVFNGYVGSEGGVGILVYETASGSIITHKRETLWTHSSWMGSTDYESGSDQLLLTNTPAGQVYFQMEAGATYLVWLYGWVSLHTERLALASGMVQCTVPFIVVDSSPAPIVN